MGTFHQHKGELHGITVVVDTEGPEIFVGRCDEADERRVVLLDAAVHHEQQSGVSKQDFLARVLKFGLRAEHPRIDVPRERVSSLRRLGEIQAQG